MQLNHTSVLTAAEFYPDLASVGIIGLILVESTMMTPKVATGEEMRIRLSRMMVLSSSKRDNWKSKKDALLYFQNKRPWSKWDPRVLSLYVVCKFHCGNRCTPLIITMKSRNMVCMSILTGVSPWNVIKTKKDTLSWTKIHISMVSHALGSCAALFLLTLYGEIGEITCAMLI